MTSELIIGVDALGRAQSPSPTIRILVGASTRDVEDAVPYKFTSMFIQKGKGRFSSSQVVYDKSLSTSAIIAHSIRFLNSSQPYLYTPLTEPVAWYALAAHPPEQ